MALLAVVWTAVFDGVFHPAIARTRSLKSFMARVDRWVPESGALYAFYPPDPGLRFYAPRPLQRWPAAGLSEESHLLLWEDQWQRLRGSDGAPLVPLAVSEGRQGGHGHLVLVAPPPGRLVAVAPSDRPAEPPGLRTGSPRP